LSVRQVAGLVPIVDSGTVQERGGTGVTSNHSKEADRGSDSNEAHRGSGSLSTSPPTTHVVPVRWNRYHNFWEFKKI
jgi:hypothetical protein